MNINDPVARAYKEVLVILNSLPEEELIKIPKEEIKFYEDNCDKEYNFEINENIPLKDQNISKKANAILVILFRDYIATEKQKEKLKEILYYNTLQKEKRAKEKYNQDNIFKKRQEVVVENIGLPAKIKKESFLKRVVNFIKKLLIKS